MFELVGSSAVIIIIIIKRLKIQFLEVDCD
jgi:hypothetical protein